MVTAYDQPALGGVYKLAAIRRAGEEWQYKVKLSEQSVKTSTPGILQVRRFSAGDEFVADMIYNEDAGEPGSMTVVDPLDPEHRKDVSTNMAHSDLLMPVLRKGKFVGPDESLTQIRNRAEEQLAKLHKGVKRFVNPHAYPCGLDDELYRLKSEMIHSLRGKA